MKLRLPSPRHPETKYVQIDTHLCQACWICIDACPQHVLGKIDLKFHRHVRVDHADACKGCLACVRACPQGAVKSRARTGA
jgi:NAD-dependent dihydropyrimidine dehydrogenase PreA subunit